MKFSKEFLVDLNEVGGYVATCMTHKSRWAVHYSGVFEYEGKLYQTTWQQGATEYQDVTPYEYEDGEIECPEVVPAQKIITVYEKV